MFQQPYGEGFRAWRDALLLASLLGGTPCCRTSQEDALQLGWKSWQLTKLTHCVALRCREEVLQVQRHHQPDYLEFRSKLQRSRLHTGAAASAWMRKPLQVAHNTRAAIISRSRKCCHCMLLSDLSLSSGCVYQFGCD